MFNEEILAQEKDYEIFIGAQATGQQAKSSFGLY